jgi:hypothetical protein
MATCEQKIWLHNIPEYADMVAVLGEYDDTYDYVGPEDWRRRLVPRHIYGIDMNVCGYIHDYRYRIGGTEVERLKADTMFFGNMMKWVELKQFPTGTNWFMKYFARDMVYKYYSAVRSLGESSFNYAD